MQANMAYYCLHELHLLPSQFMALPRAEQAFVIAAVQLRVEKEKEEQKKNKAKARRH